MLALAARLAPALETAPSRLMMSTEGETEPSSAAPPPESTARRAFRLPLQGAPSPVAPARVRYRPQAAIEAQFGCWPVACSFARALSLGLVGEASIDALIRDHLESTA